MKLTKQQKIYDFIVLAGENGVKTHEIQKYGYAIFCNHPDREARHLKTKGLVQAIRLPGDNEKTWRACEKN